MSGRYQAAEQSTSPLDAESIYSLEGSASTLIAFRPGPAAGFDLQDLDLLHHYSISTALTLNDTPQQLPVWQVYVPQLALAHDYLLHGLFAISAVHKAHLLRDTDPAADEALNDVAANHVNKALSSFRLAAQNVTRENCGALLMFSTFISFYIFASSKAGYNPFQLTDEHSSVNPSEWLRMIRGGVKMVGHALEWIKVSPLAPIIPGRNWDDNRPFQSEGEAVRDEKLARLAALWSEESDLSYAPAERQSLGDALGYLRRSYQRVAFLFDRDQTTQSNTTSPKSPESPEWDEDAHSTIKASVVAWIYAFDDVFMALLVARNRGALVLLAHYALFLHECGEFWWMDGIAADIIDSTVTGLQGHLQWIEWPLKVMARI